MSATNQGPNATSTGAGRFVTTHWSAVVRAGHGTETESQEALAELCQAYWLPLYAFARRSGHSPHDAEDLTQEFFARLLAGDTLASARQEKGRFRTFLLTALKRFLANEWQRQHAQKRGGFATLVSIDQEMAESRLGAELAREQSPDVLFERYWALALIEQVMSRLRREYEDTNRGALFEQLRGALAHGEESQSQAEIAARLGLTVPAVKMALRRLRARYREMLQEEIGRTVESSAEIEEEIRHLFSTFS